MKSTFFAYAGSVIIISFFSLANASSSGGFLTQHGSPESLAILPPPPAEDSVVFMADKSLYATRLALRNSERGRLAREDADYKNFGQAFSSAFGIEI